MAITVGFKNAQNSTQLSGSESQIMKAFMLQDKALI